MLQRSLGELQSALFLLHSFLRVRGSGFVSGSDSVGNEDRYSTVCRLASNSLRRDLRIGVEWRGSPSVDEGGIGRLPVSGIRTHGYSTWQILPLEFATLQICGLARRHLSALCEATSWTCPEHPPPEKFREATESRSAHAMTTLSSPPFTSPSRSMDGGRSDRFHGPVSPRLPVHRESVIHFPAMAASGPSR